MKLACNALIAKEKITGYLLAWRPENDKSQFLALAGYTIAQPDRLADDIRTQLLPLDAQLEETTEYGRKFRISGALIGPNGLTLHVETIWMIESVSGETKFVTLYPVKGV